mmetsp:Transcript_9143/g.30260  ORF Transcript_9143/g.30260 Transcript_9143/m.30260 type:complete len:143 (-) Transcript_9143:125-553(-)
MGKSKGGGKKKGDGLAKTIHGCANNGDIIGLEEMLEDNPAGLEGLNKDGWTPLMVAAFGGEDEATEFLIKAGSNVKAVCKDKCTALHYASAQGNIDCIRLLAAAGAPLEVADSDGDTPLSVAQDKKTKKLIEELITERENAD